MDQIEGVIAWDVPIRLAVYSWFAPVQPAWGDCEVVDAAELGTRYLCSTARQWVRQRPRVRMVTL